MISDLWQNDHLRGGASIICTKHAFRSVIALCGGGEFAFKSRLEIIFIALTDTIKSHEFYFNNSLNLKIDLKRKTDK